MELFKEVIMIQQQPTVSNDDQPTVAIITVNYYEKLAVDAMMSNKVTFVRHKPEGMFKSNSKIISLFVTLCLLQIIDFF